MPPQPPGEQAGGVRLGSFSAVDNNPEILELELEGDKTMNDPGPSLPEPPWTPAAVAGRGDKQETICCEPRHFLSENKNF